jgi:hypothetical protein
VTGAVRRRLRLLADRGSRRMEGGAALDEDLAARWYASIGVGFSF